MNKKILNISKIGILTTVLLLTGCSAKPENLLLTGSVEGRSVEVVAQNTGSITGVYVVAGQEVTPKALLAQIDDRELLLKRANLELARQIAELKYQDLKNGNSKTLVRQAIGNRDQVKAQIEGSQKELAYLRKQLSDVKSLVVSGATSKQQEDELLRALDKEQTKLDALNAQLKVAQEGLNLTLEGVVTEKLKQALLEIKVKTNEIAQLDLTIEKSKAISPSIGYIQTSNYEVGEIVTVGQKLFSIMDPSELELKVFVNEKNLALVKREMNVAVSGDFASEKPLTGIVDFIATEAEFTPKNIESKESKQEMVYEIHIKIVDPSGVIKPGMYLDADFGVLANGK